MVGGDLSIRRFTPKAQKLFGLILGDVGRPLWNINPSLDIPNFQQAILDVISSAAPVERQLTGREGEHYQLRILPYRTVEGAVDGAVITLMPPPEETKQ